MNKILDFGDVAFLKSAAELSQCPANEGREVAFAGRSNAGKSSAINYLTGQNKLARTSKTPGRTQLINFFTVNDNCRLVDLPGYGYAKVPEAVKAAWHRHIDDYLRNRPSLVGLVLVMDIRHPLREFDQMMLDWCVEANLNLHLLLTKCDKLKRGAQNAALFQVRRQIGPDASVQLFSSSHKQGRDELVTVLSHWLTDPLLTA